ncbi:MAG: hypothetical protein ACLTGI_09385 [Hoylesella buccalis]
MVGALLFISSAGFAQNQVIKLQQRKATLKTLITAIEKTDQQISGLWTKCHQFEEGSPS